MDEETCYVEYELRKWYLFDNKIRKLEEEKLDNIINNLPDRKPKDKRNITMRDYYVGLKRTLIEYPRDYRDKKIKELRAELNELMKEEENAD